MSSGLKILSLFLCVAAVYSAVACQPDLNSLDAAYDPNASFPGGGALGASGSGSGNNTSSAGSTSSNACLNGSKDGNETDVDCGGSTCPKCAAKLKCTSSKDCQSGYCSQGHCAEPTCADKIKNQDETDVDCGGDNCDPCDEDQACSVNDDCSTAYCHASVCTNHCQSGAKEADETDKDCGGSCDACADKLHCLKASDCQSKNCNNNVCQVATCSDQIQNQDETDTDCGGTCSPDKACAISAKCIVADDCQSYVCTNKKCAPDLAVLPVNIIDDFEDTDLLLPVPAKDHGNRVGNWYPFGDKGGINTIDNAAMRRGASTRVMHMTGSGFNDWGSGMGADLNNSPSKNAYDVSAFSGITFWARAGKAVSVTVALPELATDGSAPSHTCTTCDHHYFYAVAVTTTWQRFKVNFADLMLESPGVVPVVDHFDPTIVTSVQFREAKLPDPDESYDLWIDDVAFVAAD